MTRCKLCMLIMSFRHVKLQELTSVCMPFLVTFLITGGAPLKSISKKIKSDTKTSRRRRHWYKFMVEISNVLILQSQPSKSQLWNVAGCINTSEATDHPFNEVLSNVQSLVQLDMNRIEGVKPAYAMHPQKAWQQENIAPGSYVKGKCSTFQRTMKLSLIIGQCFGLNPVLGITELDTSKLRFTIFSWRCLYTIITIIGQGTFVFFGFLKLSRINNGSVIESNTSLVFYSMNCLITILFLRIATKWPRLSQQIARMEAADPNTDDTLTRRCNAACISILSLAVLEHLLSELFNLSVVLDCHNERGLYEAFITSRFYWIFYFVSYNNFIGPLTQIINIQCTFNWNFSDVFVICISLYLSSRLEQVNKRIVAVKGKFVSSMFWRSMREDYCRATSMVRKIDEVIGGIIFISFANNLFFICLQLLHSVSEGLHAKPTCQYSTADHRPFQGYEQAIYFVYSFMFLVARSLAVSLIASRVHTASQLPAHALYRVSSSAYCVEVQRFLDQIHTDNVALSGKQFFNVKRGLVLTIAGTIVTYELVLMQVTGVTPTIPTPPSTT